MAMTMTISIVVSPETQNRFSIDSNRPGPEDAGVDFGPRDVPPAGMRRGIAATLRLVALDSCAGAKHSGARRRIVNHSQDFRAFSDHHQAQFDGGPAVNEVDRRGSGAIRIDALGAAAGVPLLRRRGAIDHDVIHLAEMTCAVEVSQGYATERA
jgi:hypothetical protein